MSVMWYVLQAWYIVLLLDRYCNLRPEQHSSGWGKKHLRATLAVCQESWGSICNNCSQQTRWACKVRSVLCVESSTLFCLCWLTGLVVEWGSLCIPSHLPTIPCYQFHHHPAPDHSCLTLRTPAGWAQTKTVSGWPLWLNRLWWCEIV